MSTSRRRPEDEVWMVHAPLKNEPRPLVHAVPPSNIPYLNGVMDTDEEIAAQRPAMWFRQTDSDFVRLSKMGGRPDLLVHKSPKKPSTEPVGYPRPAWWVDMLTHNQDVSDNLAEKDIKPHSFMVPAWFAHKDRIKQSEINNNNLEHFSKPNVDFINKSYEKIEEPRKYGQLRNYMNPMKVQNQNLQRARPIPHYSQMDKIISSNGSERPKNYEEWRRKQDSK